MNRISAFVRDPRAVLLFWCEEAADRAVHEEPVLTANFAVTLILQNCEQ
jgi:hypothetical protein